MGRADSVLSGRIVFLVGARRSGTNWLQRVLAAHPDVASVPSETHLFSHGIAPLAERFHHGPLSSTKTATVYMDRDAFLDAAREFCDAVFAPLLDTLGGGARYLVERTPWHVHHLDLIGAVYPDAAVVHIIRDGRDVARSLLAQDWPESAPRDMTEAAREWRAAIEDAAAAATKLSRYYEVRYEEMLAGPAEGIGALYRWLDLPVGDDVIARALPVAGSRYNVDRTMPRVGAGKWRRGLSDADVEAFLAVAAPTLVELGYAGEEMGTRGVSRRPMAARARRAVGHVRARAWSTRAAGPPAAGPGDAASRAAPDPGSLEALHDRFDELASCINTRSYDRLPDLVVPNVEVVAVTNGKQWSERGPAGMARLVEVLRADEGRRVHQVRGDVHPAVGSFSGVFTYTSPEGGPVDIVVIVHLAARGITRLAYYRFPLSAS